LLDGPARGLGLECVLAGGDDYELCFTAHPTAAARIAAIAASAALPLARIGTITRGTALVARDEAGAPLSALPRAYDHFA
jgi:thiamine-monophosphate kinase